MTSSTPYQTITLLSTSHTQTRTHELLLALQGATALLLVLYVAACSTHTWGHANNVLAKSIPCNKQTEHWVIPYTQPACVYSCDNVQ